MRGLYIHIPFCESKCSYCDFYSKSGQKHLEKEYILAIIKRLKQIKNKTFDTVYIGGGTPSSLENNNLKLLLENINDLIDINNVLEFTVEMNPNSVNAEKLETMVRYKVNRASIGVQSFNDRELELLGRIHNSNNAKSSIDLIRKSGINNISIDLMYGLPDQSIDDFKKSLTTGVLISPEHISCYCLKIEPDTPMMKDFEQGKIKPANDDLSADMYFMMCDILKEVGYEHYEVSNFAKPGKKSKHNSLYWDQSEYIGIGPSAHSFSDGVRYCEIADTKEYIDCINSGRDVTKIIENAEDINHANEYIIFRLRTSDGIDLNEFSQKFDYDFYEKNKNKVDLLISNGYANICDNKFTLTDKGLYVSNSVLTEFI